MILSTMFPVRDWLIFINPRQHPQTISKRIQLPLKRTITRRRKLSVFDVGGFVCLASQGKCLSPPTEYLLMRRHRITVFTSKSLVQLCVCHLSQGHLMKMFIPRNTILICTLQMDMVLIAFHFQKKKTHGSCGKISQRIPLCIRGSLTPWPIAGNTNSVFHLLLL